MTTFQPEKPARTDPFTTTHWSVVLVAGADRPEQSREALAGLYKKYWRPLYAYTLRRGQNTEEAQDLVQEFFARLMEKNYLRKADPERGKFRCFLLTAFKYFLANEWDKSRAKKRGGDQTRLMLDTDWGESRRLPQPVHNLSPEASYEREWALSVLDSVLRRLRAECAGSGKERAFDALKEFLTGSSGGSSYAAVAAQLQTSESAVRVAVHRLRRRYQEALREEIAQTVANPNDVETELRCLFSALSA